MSSSSETGHNKNLVSFDGITTFVSGLDKYNPSNPALLLPALQAKGQQARKIFSDLATAMSEQSKAMAARNDAFATLKDRVTRVVSALKSFPVSKQVLENVKSLVRLIKGIRRKPKLTEEDKAALRSEGKSDKEYSSSHLSFSSRLENFEKFISLMAAQSFYTPNEKELSIEGLREYYNDLLAKNISVETSSVPVINARISRDKALYAKDEGIVDTGNAVKAYVKSVYGNNSKEYKKIMKFIFKGNKK